MSNLDKLLRCIFKNEYQTEETETVIKYHNKSFDIIAHKRKDLRKPESCVVIDKRNKHVVYNDIHIALENLCS